MSGFIYTMFYISLIFQIPYLSSLRNILAYFMIVLTEMTQKAMVGKHTTHLYTRNQIYLWKMNTFVTLLIKTILIKNYIFTMGNQLASSSTSDSSPEVKGWAFNHRRLFTRLLSVHDKVSGEISAESLVRSWSNG